MSWRVSSFGMELVRLCHLPPAKWAPPPPLVGGPGDLNFGTLDTITSSSRALCLGRGDQANLSSSLPHMSHFRRLRAPRTRQTGTPRPEHLAEPPTPCHKLTVGPVLGCMVGKSVPPRALCRMSAFSPTHFIGGLGPATPLRRSMTAKASLCSSFHRSHPRIGCCPGTPT